MSLLGGIQPGRLRSYLVDALADGPSNDGLIQRFQVCVSPDTYTDFTFIDRKPDKAAPNSAALVLRKLASLRADPPLQLGFSPDAQELFREWLTELEVKVRGNSLSPAMACHLAKYRSLMPSLALLFQVADWAAGYSDGEVVSLEHALQAMQWCDYLESHAARVYSCVTTPELRTAHALAAKIRQGKVASQFSLRDIYLNGWANLNSPEMARMAVGVLTDAGWIRLLAVEPSRVGRHSERYQVNPEVLSGD